MPNNLNDDFLADNIVEFDFMVTDSLFSLCRLDDSLSQPINKGHWHFSDRYQDWDYCVSFNDSNLTRMTVKGLSFALSNGDSSLSSLIGEKVDIRALEWNSNDWWSPYNIKILSKGTYTYSSNMDEDIVYAQFDTPVNLDSSKIYYFVLILITIIIT